MYPADAYVEIHRDDASALGIQTADRVMVASRRGAVQVRASVVDTLQKGVLFMPMHYPETNFLTHPAFDPQSHQPSYKYAAVSIRAIRAPA
jgi:anaerobic selenocysteine-containing dehydrogenase